LGIASTTTDTSARVLPAEASDAPGTVRVEVTVQTPKQGGDMGGQVQVQTSHGKVQQFPLTIHLQSVDGITVQPPAIYWSMPGAEPSGSLRPVTLLKRSGTFRVLAAETEHAALRAEIDLGSAGTTHAAGSIGSDHEISLRYAGGLPKGTTQGTLRVTTDDPDAPMVEIPYQVTVE
jgi:hypothetical protein